MNTQKQGENRTTSKQLIVQALINKIEDEDQVNQIKTNVVQGFQSPERIASTASEDEGFIPDVITEVEGRKNVYAIELSEKQYELEKWKLFSLYSIRSKGNFNIVAPKNNIPHIRDMLKENKVNARLIYFT